MKTYNVEVECITTGWVEVEASNEEEAMSLAVDAVQTDGLRVLDDSDLVEVDATGEWTVE